MVKNKILIVGGYGQVGKVISKKLGELYPKDVIVAGRNFKKAKKLSEDLNNNVLPLEFDLYNTAFQNEFLKEVRLVIMCIDQKNLNFVNECSERGIKYIDITADYEFITEIQSLENKVIKNNALFVLSVGLAPGITNLLVKHAQTKIEKAKYANIYLMFGSGEKHGEAAYRWFFSNINKKFKTLENGQEEVISNFGSPSYTKFLKPVGNRKTYRFNFSDQHILLKNLNLDSVKTRVCYDSVFLTQMIAFFKKVGISVLLKSEKIQNYLIKFLHKFNSGSEKFSVKVDVGINNHNPLYECYLRGNKESYITGLVATRVAQSCIEMSLPNGIFHIEELFNPQQFIESLGKDVQFKETTKINNN